VLGRRHGARVEGVLTARRELASLHPSGAVCSTYSTCTQQSTHTCHAGGVPPTQPRHPTPERWHSGTGWQRRRRRRTAHLLLCVDGAAAEAARHERLRRRRLQRRRAARDLLLERRRRQRRRSTPTVLLQLLLCFRRFLGLLRGQRNRCTRPHHCHIDDGTFRQKQKLAAPRISDLISVRAHTRAGCSLTHRPCSRARGRPCAGPESVAPTPSPPSPVAAVCPAGPPQVSCCRHPPPPRYRCGAGKRAGVICS
jgi:hypothetical protein